MKYIIVLFVILAGCSKSTVSPDLTGHWSFSNASFSGDYTISKNSNGYVVAAGGNFVLNGHSYTTGPDLLISTNGTNSYVVMLRTAVVSNQASWVQFDMSTTSDFSSVTGGNPISWQEFIPGKPNTSGTFDIKSFPITRK